MKMLFYSSDDAEVDRVSKELLNAGIPCEVRKGPTLHGKSAHTAQAELWIRNDRDCHRAFLLCVQLGVGFAKRAPRKYQFDGSDFDLPLDAEAEGGKAENDPPANPEEHRVFFIKRVTG